MLRGRKHGHIHIDFRNEGNSGKRLDTRCRGNEVELGEVFFSSSQDQRFRVGLAKFKATHVGTDNAEFFSLLGAYFSAHSGRHFFICSFHSFRFELGNIRNFFGRIF